MTEHDAEQIIAMIENHWQRRIEGSRQLWADFLTPLDAELVTRAVAKLAAVDSDFPKISTVRDMLASVTSSTPAIEPGLCPSCYGDKVVLVQTRPPVQSTWMKERGLEASTSSAHEEYAPCPDCNSTADDSYVVLGKPHRPLDPATVRDRMEPARVDPYAERSREVPDDVKAWLQEKQETLLKRIP